MSCPGLEPPGPVAERLAGRVHPALAAEAEHVLRRDHAERGAGAERQLDQLPRLAAGQVGLERVGVVGGRVDHLVLAVVLEPVRAVARRLALERPEDHDHPGEPERVAELLDVRRDQPQVLGDHGQRPELGLGRAEERLPGAGQPAAGARVRLVLRDRPEVGEAAEVVDPGQVEELRASGAAARSTSDSRPSRPRPSRRAGCPSAARAGPAHPGARRPRARRGRAPGAPGGRRFPGRRRSGRRRSRRRRGRARTRAARSTRARTGPGRRRCRRRAPSPRSSSGSPPGTRRAPRPSTGASGSARKPLQAANADDDAYGEPTSSGGPSGSTCHQLCPAASSQSTNA